VGHARRKKLVGPDKMGGFGGKNTTHYTPKNIRVEGRLPSDDIKATTAFGDQTMGQTGGGVTQNENPQKKQATSRRACARCKKQPRGEEKGNFSGSKTQIGWGNRPAKGKIGTKPSQKVTKWNNKPPASKGVEKNPCR